MQFMVQFLFQNETTTDVRKLLLLQNASATEDKSKCCRGINSSLLDSLNICKIIMRSVPVLDLLVVFHGDHLFFARLQSLIELS